MPPVPYGRARRCLPTGGHLAVRVVGALVLGLPLAQVRDVDQRVGVEVRPVVEHLDQVRPGAGLDGGGDASLQVVGVDGLEGDLDLGLLGVLGDLPPHLHVAFRDEVHPVQQVDAGGLGQGGRPARGQDALDTRGAGERAGREARLEELPSIVPSVHGHLLVPNPIRELRRREQRGPPPARTSRIGHPTSQAADRNEWTRHIQRPDPGTSAPLAARTGPERGNSAPGAAGCQGSARAVL